MKKGDLIWISGLLAFVAFVVYPPTHAIFNAATVSHPYLMGFTKFFILATMGELMAIRIVTGDYKKPVGLLQRAVIWGIIGFGIVAIFGIFSGGVTGLVEKGLLPGKGNAILTAFFISAFMNTCFAPAMMIGHRITDTWIDLAYAGKGKKVTLKDITSTIDWNNLVGFVLFKTIPFFWIPAHTITFLLPAEYRVLMAAFLSIALGAILAFSKRKK